MKIKFFYLITVILMLTKKLKKNDIALSMKFYGRQIEKFKCIKCLAVYQEQGFSNN